VAGNMHPHKMTFRILESLTHAVIATDVNGKIIYWNAAAETLYGWSADEILGRDILEITPTEENKAQAAEVMNALSQGESWTGEFMVRHRNGRVFPAFVTDTPITDEDGQVIGVVGLSLDIPREKLVAKEQERYSERLQGLAQAALAINSQASQTDLLQMVSDTAMDLIEAHQAVISLTINQDWAQAITAVSLSEKYSQYHSYDKMPDGSGIYRLVCEENRTYRMTQAELEAHPAWQAFGRERGTHPPMRGWLAVPLVDREGSNLGLVQLSDKREGKFTRDDELILQQLARMAAVAIQNQHLLAAVHRHASTLEETVAYRTHELFAANEQLTQEIEERIRAERALQLSEERWRRLVEANPDPILITINGVCAYVNPAGLELIGASSLEEVISRSPVELVLEEQRELALTRLEAVERGEDVEPQIFDIQRKDGSIRCVEVFAIRVNYEGHRAVQMVVRDVTERKLMEEELEQARQRLSVAREGERVHLARELHDGVLQHLIGMSYQVAQVERALHAHADANAVKARDGLQEHRQELLQTARQLRRLIRGLRPVGLEELGLAAAIEDFVAYLREEHPGRIPDILVCFASRGSSVRI
jgi:PAS domain S-box-containing protein